MSASEDHLRRFVFWERLRSPHQAEYDELLQFLDDLATDADPEMKVAIAWYIRHLRFICQMHCNALERILTSTKDQRIRRLAERALAADDFVRTAYTWPQKSCLRKVTGAAGNTSKAAYRGRIASTSDGCSLGGNP